LVGLPFHHLESQGKGNGAAGTKQNERTNERTRAGLYDSDDDDDDDEQEESGERQGHNASSCTRGVRGRE
jgi:hypothetical protein